MSDDEKEKERLKQEFSLDVSIEGYLKLRSKLSDEEAGLWMIMTSSNFSPSHGMDLAFQIQSELEQFNIDVINFIGALDGEDVAIDALSLEILEALSVRREAEKSSAHAVANGEVIGDALINLIIVAILESVKFYEFSPPNSFIILLKFYLGVIGGRYIETRSHKDMIGLVAKLKASNSELTNSEIAKMFGVNKSTITRWIKEPHFELLLNALRNQEAGKPFLSNSKEE